MTWVDYGASAIGRRSLSDRVFADAVTDETPVPSMSATALELVNGARQDRYGPPDESLARIGAAWGALLGTDAIPGWRVALLLAAMKLVRAAGNADEDSVTDAFGYLHLVERLRP